MNTVYFILFIFYFPRCPHMSAGSGALRRAHCSTSQPPAPHSLCPGRAKTPTQSACRCSRAASRTLQPLPTGRWALPSVSTTAGKVSLPPWPHRLPSFPSLRLLISFRARTARRALNLFVRGSPQELTELRNMLLPFFSSFHFKTNQNNEELGWLHPQNRSPSAADQEKTHTLLEPCCSQLPT